MEYRKAAADESRSIAEVIVSTWKRSYRNIFSSSYLDSLDCEGHEKIIRENIENDREIIFTASYNGRVVGMVSGKLLDDESEYDSELVAIYMLPEFQHRGTGRILFSMMTDELRESGADTMILWTFKENRERGFYKRMGGTLSGEKVMNTEDGDIPCVSYVWRNLTLL